MLDKLKNWWRQFTCGHVYEFVDLEHLENGHSVMIHRCPKCGKVMRTIF